MPKKPASQDWTPAAIKYALHSKNITLRSIAIAHGYHDIDVLRPALVRPYPKAERLISEALSAMPKDIWPSRYNLDGSPRSGRGERGLGRYKAKCSKAPNGRIDNNGSGI
ncbi:MAG: helix-turn-helix domain-containing protein [Pseudomonadota bacterium]|nr:helix-turn-helix domain-containing protein [Pseudomonadota bacterium]